MMMMHPSRAFARFLLPIVLLTVCATAQVLAQDTATWRTVEEQWYTLEINGERAGWSHRVKLDDGQRYRINSVVNMKMSRMGDVLEMTLESSSTETHDGKPVMMEMRRNMSRQVVHTSWEFVDGERVKVTTRIGMRDRVNEVDGPEGEWLPPAAMERFVENKRRSGEKEFTVRTIDPNAGLAAMTVTYERVGEEIIEVDGKDVAVTVWKSRPDLVPMDSIEKIGPDNTLLVSEAKIAGLGTMVTRLARSEAHAKGEPAAAPEMIVQSFIEPDQPIANSLKTVRSKLRLIMKEGEMPALPSAGAQRFERSADKKSAVLTIDINDNLPASESEKADKTFRSASSMIDSDDEMIQKLAMRALAQTDADAAQERAEALRAFVHRHINRKGMETAFASASETARMRTGDCSEHAVLLAALMRAADIPARVATGLVYVAEFGGREGVFGWHMWTQALIDGRWVDFDATLPVRYDAAHVLTSVSSLDDGALATDMAAVLQLLGNLEIEVIEVHHK